MTSTRSLRTRFVTGEKVLCYEPDPTKVKVLYKAKILEVLGTTDNQGRRSTEYLIHFQGWNSSWDRYVSESLVLKDNEENRQLQAQLFEKANIQRRDRKYSRQTLSEDTVSYCSGSSEYQESSSSCSECYSDDDISENDESNLPSLLLPESLCHILDEDNAMIVANKKEMADGVRILIDFYLETQLLYKEEQQQFNKIMKQRNLELNSLATNSVQSLNVVESGICKKKKKRNSSSSYIDDSKEDFIEIGPRILRSHVSAMENDDVNFRKYQVLQKDENKITVNMEDITTITNMQQQQDTLLNKVLSWKMYTADKSPYPPSCLYGSIHLLRLFVRLPEILSKMGMNENKLEILLDHLEYLDNQKLEIFSKSLYESCC